MIGKQLQVNKDGTLTISCKIPKSWLQPLRAICAVRESNMNDLIKMCLHFLIETASLRTDASPDMKVLLHMMRVSANWSKMFNHVANGKLDIAQVVLILQQSEDSTPRDGFGLAMFDKPFLPGEEPKMTLCVDDILERIVEVSMGHDDYWDLREVAQHFDAKSVREALIRMVDAQAIINRKESDDEEMPSLGNQTAGGRVYEYAQRTRQTKRRTPDSEAQRQLRITFNEDDAELSDMESAGWTVIDDERAQCDAEHAELERSERDQRGAEDRRWLEENSDIRPFGNEW